MCSRLMMRFCISFLLSNDWENFFMNLFLIDSCHFDVIFLFHFWSYKSPINLKFYGDVFRNILYNFNRYWQSIERFNKPVAWVHRDEVLFICFYFENKLMIWDVCDIKGLTDIECNRAICQISINIKRIGNVHFFSEQGT